MFEGSEILVRVALSLLKLNETALLHTWDIITV